MFFLPGIPTAAAGEKRKVSPDETTPDKKSRLDKSTFRSWSVDADGKPCKIFTLKCMFGNPDEPLPYYVKSQKVADIKDILEKRGLDTKGTKPVLLERLQKDLPYVRIELDSRECLQRLVNSFLHFMGWTNEHLFEITLPHRGPTRKLVGAAFDAFEGVPPFDFGPPAGGFRSLDELSLQAGDKLDVLYDFGDSNEFRIEIESVKDAQESLPEVKLGYSNQTRTRLVNKGGRMFSQYGNSEDDNSEDGDY
jgi:SAP domain/Plasmid pRiA4b ORF-3-like protein